MGKTREKYKISLIKYFFPVRYAINTLENPCPFHWIHSNKIINQFISFQPVLFRDSMYTFDVEIHNTVSHINKHYNHNMTKSKATT